MDRSQTRRKPGQRPIPDLLETEGAPHTILVANSGPNGASLDWKVFIAQTAQEETMPVCLIDYRATLGAGEKRPNEFPVIVDSLKTAAAKVSEETRKRLAEFYWSGKHGSDLRTGQRAFEFKHWNDAFKFLWLREDGTVLEVRLA